MEELVPGVGLRSTCCGDEQVPDAHAQQRPCPVPCSHVHWLGGLSGLARLHYFVSRQVRCIVTWQTHVNHAEDGLLAHNPTLFVDLGTLVGYQTSD